jgi:hypothetical protein
MTQENAQRAANVILGIVAVGAAYYVLRTPPLRRMAFQLAGAALTGTLPVWFRNQAQQAWSQSGETRRPARRLGAGSERGVIMAR